MANIPFNPNQATPQMQPGINPLFRNAPQLQDNSGIINRANQNLAGALTGALDFGLDKMAENQKGQDDSDMIAARAAISRLRQEESQKLRSTSNLKEIDGINSEYQKRYESIISGKNTNGNPYFRNESGKRMFNEQYMTGFNTKRSNSTDELKFDLDRKNTSTGFWNGIKSIPQSDYYDQPEAEDETREYVNLLVENGFMTEEEGNNQKKIQLGNLDMERANRKLLDIDPTPAPEEGGFGITVTVEQQLDGYKDYIDGLGNMSDQQKAHYKAKADNLLDQAKSSHKIYNKERNAEIKRQKNEFEFSLFKSVAEAEGKDRTNLVSAIVNNPGISVETRKKFLTQFKSGIDAERKLQEKKTLTVKDTQEKAKIEYNKEQLRNSVYAYDPTDDLHEEKKAELMSMIASSGGGTEGKSKLVAYLEKGGGIPAEMKEERKFNMDRLDNIFGLTKLSKEKFKAAETTGHWNPIEDDRYRMEITKDEFGNEIETFDGLKELERIKAKNSIVARYDELIRFKKFKEADEFMKKESQKWEESENDEKLFNNYFKKN